MYEVISIEFVENYTLKFKFKDNSEGIVDFFDYTNKTGLYQDLKDIDFFKKFYLDEELSTIVWPNGLDIAPDTLYIKATGKYPNGLQ